MWNNNLISHLSNFLNFERGRDLIFYSSKQKIKKKSNLIFFDVKKNQKPYTLISQEHNKYIHYKIEKDKFKSVLKDLLKNPQEFNESSESQELHKPQEIYESSSNFEIKNEMEQIENHLEFDIIYEKNESDEVIYYDNQLLELCILNII